METTERSSNYVNIEFAPGQPIALLLGNEEVGVDTALLDLVAEEAGIRLAEAKLVEDTMAARELIYSTVAEQSVHAEAPGMAVYVPVAHGSQMSRPMTGAKLPATQL